MMGRRWPEIDDDEALVLIRRDLASDYPGNTKDVVFLLALLDEARAEIKALRDGSENEGETDGAGTA